MKRQLVMIGFTVFACLTLIFAYGIAIFGFLFPAPMISFMDSLGASRAALMFSERRLSNSDNLDHLLDTLNRNTDANRHNRIITLTEQLINRKYNLDTTLDRGEAFELINTINTQILQEYTGSLVATSQYQRAANFMYEVISSAGVQESRLPLAIFQVWGTPAMQKLVGEPNQPLIDEFDAWFDDELQGIIDGWAGNQEDIQGAIIFRDLVIFLRG